MFGLKLARSLSTVTLAAAVSFGATPVARVIGTESIDVDGITTPARNYTPVQVGSRVSTKRGAAVLQFRDGSSVSMQANSVVSLEGSADAVQVRIVNGAAFFSVPPSSRLRVVDSKGETLNRVLSSAVPAAQSANSMRERLPLDAGVVYRGNTRLPGGFAPTSAITVGSFSGATFHAGAAGSTYITTPSGLRINLAATTNPQTGQVSYTVASITQTVTTPAGTEVEVTVTSGSLIGATVGGVSGETQTGNEVTIQFTPPGSTTPLTPSQAATSVQTAVTTTIQNQVQTGQLPAGTTPPAPTPVSTGTFSSSGN